MMNLMNIVRRAALLCAFSLVAGAAVAQTRGEVEGFATGQIRRVSKPVVAPTAQPKVEDIPEHKPVEWVRIAEVQAKYTPKFQYGARGGVSALKLINTSEINNKGVGGRQYAVKNSCVYVYQDTPRKERQNRVSWNVAAFGRYNFGGGQGNLQVELQFNENRYETVLINEQWDPSKRIMTGTVYDRSIDIPIMLGWKYSIFRLYFGPSIKAWTGYKTANEGTVKLLNTETKQYETLPVNVKNVGFDINNPGAFRDFGLQKITLDHSLIHFVCGLSFEFSNVVFDARYTTPFVGPKQQYYSFNNPVPLEYSLMMHAFQFSFGFMF